MICICLYHELKMLFQNVSINFTVDEKTSTLTNEKKEQFRLSSEPLMYFGFENEWIVCYSDIIHCSGKPRFKFSQEDGILEKVTKKGVMYQTGDKMFFNETELPDSVFPCYWEDFYKTNELKTEFSFCDIKGTVTSKPHKSPANFYPLRKDEYILEDDDSFELFSSKGQKFQGKLLYVSDDLIITSRDRFRYKDKCVVEDYSVTFVPGSHVYLLDKQSYAIK